MEALVAQSLSYTKISKPLIRNCSTSTSISPSFLQCKTSAFSYQSVQNLGLKRLNFQCIRIIKPFPKKNVGVVYASEGDTSPANVVQGWILEPVGDGDWKHIGFKVPMPGAYEIFSSDEMVIGREPQKADLVIPVATVSGMHARIQNKEGSLYISDLDSTNGTYINEKRVQPGFTAVVPPGSLLTFGDTHLAIFRVLKIEKTLEKEADESEEKTEIEGKEAAAQPDTTN
ncbi:uncharacterized protein LOC110688217 [Chenopodium quinoa]|uniref:FHA domain-containing protein n=1 Tax=Chenopodium quinoa TaxID=63459 RepID=A0A803KRE3_CHEQI|nr:uncharacterized protein LOC110688217 [Chenopodium quinoa]